METITFCQDGALTWCCKSNTLGFPWPTGLSDSSWGRSQQCREYAMHRPVLKLTVLLWKIRMTFSSPPGEGLGAVKSILWKDILKTRCWSTDMTDGKPLVTVPGKPGPWGSCWERVSLAKGLSKVMEGLKVWHWGLCIVYLYPRSVGNAKECSNYCTIALISHASEVMIKILQSRLQQ